MEKAHRPATETHWLMGFGSWKLGSRISFCLSFAASLRQDLAFVFHGDLFHLTDGRDTTFTASMAQSLSTRSSLVTRIFQPDEFEGEEDQANFRPVKTRVPARQNPDDSDFEGDEDYDEEPSLLDNLLANPKRLAIIGGIAVACIVVLVVIISLLGKGGSKTAGTNNSAKTESSAAAQNSVSATGNNAVDIASLLNNESSTLIPLETSVPTESSSTEGEGGKDDEESRDTVTEVINYTIEEGDSWSVIIQQFYGEFDMDLIYALCDYNNMAIDDVIYPGLEIKIPPESDLR